MANINSNGITSIKAKNKLTGNIGEVQAIAFLEKNKYKILDTNYKTKFGEIDIVAQDKDNRIIFVEVKARNTAKFGYPREAVTPKKQLVIRRVAEHYLLCKKLKNAYTRFDVIEILDGNITHLKNAF